jgi:hypothetical protein
VKQRSVPARPTDARGRLHELEEREKTAELSRDEAAEFRAIIWPAHFADPQNLMWIPEIEIRKGGCTKA